MINSAPLALTPGDPAGIGLDLCVLLAQHTPHQPIVIIADPELLQQRADALGLAFEYALWSNPKAIEQRYYVLPIAADAAVTPGVLNPAHAEYVLATLNRAIDGCLYNEFAALVTGPVHKANINNAGYRFSGHTEYLAEHSGTKQVVMMLCNTHMRVALATTHLPLTKVSTTLTAELLESVIRILHRELQKKFGLGQPRITVCGLNPHAGEDGHLGTEEQTIIGPVIQQLQQQGMQLLGPVSADTAFVGDKLNDTDAVLAMYHDQGLPVIKHAGFGTIVNVTLGLPFVRTSVDHGTALELAGSGEVDTGSLQAAIDMARLMSQYQYAQSA